MKPTTILSAFSATFLALAGSADAALVAHYKFDDASGSTAIDSSVNGNNATNAGGGTWVAGKVGGAYDQPRFTVGDSSAVQFVGAVGFTISLWVQTTSTSNFMLAGIDGFSTGGGDDMYALKTSSDNVLWYLKGVGTFTSTDTLTNYSAATTDGWVHVVGVYVPGVSSRLYINGALDTTGSGGGAISNFPDPFGMGRYYNRLSGVLNGALDDVQVYDQALSDDDVTFLHANPGSAIAIPEPSALALLGLGTLSLLRRRRS